MRSLTLLAVLIASNYAIPFNDSENSLSRRASIKGGNFVKTRSSVARANAVNETGKSSHGNLAHPSDHRTKSDVIKDVVEFFKSRNINNVVVTENSVLVGLLIRDRVISQEDVALIRDYNFLYELFTRYGSLNEFIGKEFGESSDKEHEKPKESGENSEKEHDKPKESGGASDIEHDKPKETDGSSDKEHDKPKDSDGSSNKEHDVPKESGGASEKEHEKPKEFDGSSEKEHEKPKEFDGSSDKEHEKPKESDGSSNKEHDVPKESGGSLEKEHERPKESGGSSDKEHEKLKESGEISDKEHNKPKESDGSSEKEHGKPKDTEGSGHKNLEPYSDHRTKRDVIEDVVEFFYNKEIDNLAITENSVLVGMLVKDGIINEEDLNLLGDYNLLYELFIRHGSLNEFIGKEFGGDSDEEHGKPKEDNTEGKMVDEEYWKGWGDNDY